MRRFGREHATRAALRGIILPYVFGLQQAFICDPAKLKLALCGRRAGKTIACAIYLLLEAACHPGSLCPYIALTRKNAKLLLWPELQRLNARFKLNIKFNHTDLIAEFPNGSKIWLAGADNEAQIEKFRGFFFRLVVLDECASFGPHIEQLIEDVLEPGLMQLNGTMAMIGTPGPILAGAFYRNSTERDRGWSTHHWTVFENPHIPGAAAWVEERRRLTKMRQATYEREWLALWTPDLDALVYHYDASINQFPGGALPQTDAPWEYGLGVDLGYDPDPTAFCVIAWNLRHPKVFVVESERLVGLIPSQVADRITYWRGRYMLNKIVADAAGLGKGIVAEWRQRYNIPVTPARDKHLKREHIQLLNDDFRAGRILIRQGLPLQHELSQVVWDDKRNKVSDQFPNDLCDAFEYIWVEAKHFAHRPLTPVLTGEARLLEEAKRYEERAAKRIAQAEEPW